MFTIKGGKDKFTQWDLNQQVLNPCMNAGDEVVFRNASGAAIVQYAHKDGSDVVADVPNILLQDSRNIVVDLGQGKDRHKECRTNFMVEKASKPEGYVFVDNVKPKPSTGGSGGGVSAEEVTTIVKEQFPHIKEQFPVTFSTADMQNWTCDKTLAEITEAINGGKEVVGSLMGEIKVDFICVHKNGSLKFGAVVPDDLTLQVYTVGVFEDEVRVTMAFVEMTAMGG